MLDANCSEVDPFTAEVIRSSVVARRHGAAVMQLNVANRYDYVAGAEIHARG